MRHVWKRSLVVVSGSLILFGGPLPSFAQDRPDVYVKILDILKETSPVHTVEKVVIAVGNDGAAAPSRPAVASLQVRSGDRVVCSATLTGLSLPPHTSMKAFEFRVTHAGPATQLPSPPPKKGPAGRPDVVQLPVKYTIGAHAFILIPGTTCAQVESVCGNNTEAKSLKFAPGGTPACLKLR